MTELTLDSRQVEAALGMKPSSLRLMADKVLLDGHGRRGVVRRWSVADLTLLLVAQRFSDRGFIVPVAVTFARAISEAELHRLIADDAALLYLVAWPDDAARQGWAFALKREKGDAVDTVLDHSDALVFDVRKIVQEAMNLVLAALQTEGNRNA